LPVAFADHAFDLNIRPEFLSCINLHMNCFYIFIFVLTGLLFTSCQKEIPPETEIGLAKKGPTFEAKVNGKLTTFNVFAATLLRISASNTKRFEIAGISDDGSQRLVLTVADSPAAGNNITVKEYQLRLFNQDDPTTPVDESVNSNDGFITYSTLSGNNNWTTDLYAENGVIKITACNANARKITGTFTVKDSSLTGGPVVHFTEGKFTALSYEVLN
jgi:hypothetical protein